MATKCLNSSNIEEYVKEKYHRSLGITSMKKELKVTPLLQKNFGTDKDGDCTLCAMTMLLNYLGFNRFDPENLYSFIKQNARKYLYNGDVYGSIPIFNNCVLNDSKSIVNEKRRPSSGYLKDIGYNYNKVKNLINGNMPVLLNMTDDSRHVYTGHTVLIIGYEYYTNRVKFFKIYDNWSQEVRYLDYDGLSSISSINYFR